MTLVGRAKSGVCRPLEVVQLQCMAQSLQISPTGNPPERHVLLWTQKPNKNQTLFGCKTRKPITVIN